MTLNRYSPAAQASAYRAPLAVEPVHARLSVPGSKSLTNRELVLAAISDRPSTIYNPLHSDDSQRMVDALRALGVAIDEVPGDGLFGPNLHVSPAPLVANTTINSGQAGTVMRFMTALVGLATGETIITADDSALHRPMGPMIAALRDLGVDIDDGGTWTMPFTVHGRGHVRGGRVLIDASRSSQFISGLLLAAPRFDVGIHLIHTGEHLPSLPHIDMTIELLSKRGVHVERPAAGEWLVEAGVPRGKRVTIEPDLSNAAPFLVAAMVTGGEVAIENWPARSTQPGALLPEILHAMGARVSRRGKALTVRGGSAIRAINLDLAAIGELAPTLAALAVFANAPMTLRGIEHIRSHESDRISALVAGINALGGSAEERADGLVITPTQLSGGIWPAAGDHRIATAGAIIGLKVRDVQVDDITTTAKTFPEFPELWGRMLRGEEESA